MKITNLENYFQVNLKAILIEKINAFLAVHQENREKAKNQIDQFLFENK